jgi:hypothetical protein
VAKHKRPGPPEPPLDDPQQWQTLDDAFEPRLRSTGSHHLAALDLTSELRNGLPCMRRNARGERERVPREHWNDHHLEHWKTGGLVVVLPRRGGGTSQIIREHGYTYYVGRTTIGDSRAQESVVSAHGGRRKGAGRGRSVSQEQIADAQKIFREFKTRPSAAGLLRKLRILNKDAGWTPGKLRKYVIKPPPRKIVRDGIKTKSKSAV